MNSDGLLKQKLRAWLTHVGLSALVLTPIIAVMVFVWYPTPWFEVQGVLPIIGVLLGVDLVLGPVLTFVVYKKDKPSLRFDLTVIVLIQVLALAYGSWSIYSERPRYVVFAVDRYEALAEKDIDPVAGLTDRIGRLPLRGPLYVYAQMPMGEEFQRFQDSVMFGGGPDLERRTEYWIPHVDARTSIFARAQPLSAIEAALPEHQSLIEGLANQLAASPEQLRYLPLVGKKHDFIAVLDPVTAEIVAVESAGPWMWQDFSAGP